MNQACLQGIVLRITESSDRVRSSCAFGKWSIEYLTCSAPVNVRPVRIDGGDWIDGSSANVCYRHHPIFDLLFQSYIERLDESSYERVVTYRVYTSCGGGRATGPKIK